MTVKRQLLGRKGENVAAKFLLKKGYRILDQNFRCALGEIDLIVQEGETIIFVEVRSRSTKSFGMPQESVGIQKQRKLRRLAQYYIYKRQLSGNFRFDVLCVMFQSDGHFKGIEHFTNAF